MNCSPEASEEKAFYVTKSISLLTKICNKPTFHKKLLQFMLIRATMRVYLGIPTIPLVVRLGEYYFLYNLKNPFLTFSRSDFGA